MSECIFIFDKIHLKFDWRQGAWLHPLSRSLYNLLKLGGYANKSSQIPSIKVI